MENIWCELRGGTMEGAPVFRAIVRAGKLVKWRGQWRESAKAAIEDAERMAESLAGANKGVLTLARTLGPRPVVSGFGKSGAANFGAGNGAAGSG